jgi:hypothetical protein
MEATRALDRAAVKQHREMLFESPLDIVNEDLLTRGERLSTLKRWQLSILSCRSLDLL